MARLIHAELLFHSNALDLFGKDLPMHENEALILQAISEKNGQVNWYQLGRKHFADFDHSENFGTCLVRLKERGLIREIVVDSEPLPKLSLTEHGDAVVRRMQW